jgi:di/tricarboxylate transporter
MTIALVLGLMAVAFVLLSLEWVPVDVVALGVLVVLLVSGVLTPAEALAGFGNEAIVVLAGLFVLTAGLRQSGAIEEVSHWLGTRRGGSRRRGAGLLFGTVAAVSAFVSNTSCTALFLPAGIGLAKRLGTSASRILMPLAFAAILGGTVTAIGTSTNVIVRGLLPQYGEAPLGLFEMAPVALPIVIVGLFYLVATHRLLPDRRPPGDGDTRDMRDFLSEIEVLAGSWLVGRSLAEADLRRQFGVNVLTVARGGPAVEARRDVRLAAGDRLLVSATAENLRRLVRDQGGVRWCTGGGDVPAGSPSGPTRWVEILLLPRSDVVGRSLGESHFRQRHGANILAVSRHGELVGGDLASLKLHIGDVLLAQVDSEARERLREQPGLLLLTDRAGRPPGRSALLAAAVFVGTLGLAASGVVGLAGSVLLGCLLLVATRCLTPQEAYQAIEWRLLVLIAGMMAYGAAMTKTGAADLLAGQLLELLDGAPPRVILLAFYLLTLLLTQPLSNQAAVLLVLPVAMDAAMTSGVSLRAMAITVALAASSSFLTPLEPSSLLVYAPGGYRFSDFWKLGFGLTLLALALTVGLVPIVWPS